MMKSTASLKITSGQFKGRKLASPEGWNTRPTASKARLALFNMLSHAPWGVPIIGARVLDLFSGTGVLGFEALSLGAAHAMFVENDRVALAVLRKNVADLGVAERANIISQDVRRLSLGNPPPFNLVFCDPPYHKGLAPIALARLTGNLLADKCVMIVETAYDEEAVWPKAWQVLDRREYGAAAIWALSLAD